MREEDGKEDQWQSPPIGWLKINVDVVVDVQKQVVGLEVVIRDEKDNCIAAAVNTTKYFGNVAMAEAAAIKWGMKVALRAGLASVLLESDCLEVVELVNNRCSSMAEISWMISEILEMNNSFQNFRAQHTARIYNSAAHALGFRVCKR